MLLRGKDVAEYELAWLLTGGIQKEIWAAIDMAEDLPSSCVYYLGGGVSRQNMPPVIVDQSRQPLTEKEPDDEESNKLDIEQHELQDDVARNAVHWPMAVAVWSPPASLQPLCAAAQVERRGTTTMLPGVGSTLGVSAGGPGSKAVKPAGGVQLITTGPPGLIGPPVPTSAGILPFTLPDDDTTPRCAAQLARILGPIPLNLLAPGAPAQQYTPPPVASAVSALTAAAHAATPSPTASLDKPHLVISTTTGVILPQPIPSTAPGPGIPVVTVTTTTSIPLAATPTTTRRHARLQLPALRLKLEGCRSSAGVR